LSHYPSRPCI